MGHNAHLRKILENQLTQMIIIMWIKRKKPSLFTLWELNGSSFKGTGIPFTQVSFVPSLVEIGPVFIDKIFFLSMYLCYFIIISPWKKGGSSFEQIWIPFTQGYFVPSLVEIDPVVLEKKMKIWKVYANDYDDEQTINFDRKSLLEPSAQVSLKLYFVLHDIVLHAYWMNRDPNTLDIFL